MGDDWPDLPLLRRAAFAVAPPGAHVEVKARRPPRHQRAPPASVRRASSAIFSSSPPAATPGCSTGRSARWMAPPEAAEAELVEPGLEDDDLVDLSFAGPEPIGPAAAPWYARLLDVGSAYLPLLLMAALAAGTWWLVRDAPVADVHRAAPPLRHEADYVMTNFVVQRFAADGSLRTQIEGRPAAPLSRQRHAGDRRCAHPCHRRQRHGDARFRQASPRQRRRQRSAADRRRAGDAAGRGQAKKRSNSAANSCTRSATSSRCARTSRSSSRRAAASFAPRAWNTTTCRASST